MNVAMQAFIAIGSVAILIGLMALVKHQANVHGLRAEVQRKIVHMGAGLYALSLPWLFEDKWPVLMLLAITVAVMLILRLPGLSNRGIGATLHSVERRSYGDLLLVLAIGTVYLIADKQAILYVLPLLIVALSDAAAALTGTTYGRWFFAVENGRKSVEGCVAFFITSFCLSMICLLLLSDIPRVNVIYLAAIVAAFGTLVEADSWNGFDNFFLPTGLVIFLEMHLQTTPLILFTIMAVFLISIAVATLTAPRLKMSTHMARVYVIATFLLLSALDTAHVILPLLVFLAHAICKRINPSSSKNPELDVVAAVALISYLLLTLGRTTGTFNIPLYGLATLSMTLSFCALLVSQSKERTEILACISIGAFAILAYFWFYRMSNNTNAVPVPVSVLFGTCLLLFIFPFFLPQCFKSLRVVKIACLALISPLVIYGSHMFQ